MISNLIQKKRPYMKGLYAISMLILALFLIVSCGSVDGSGKQDNKPVSEPARFKIGYSNFAYPPLHYRDETGNLVGFDIDLACNAFTLMNAEPEFIPIDWAKRAELLEDGEIDMLWGGLEKDTLDESKVKFTNSYLRSNIILLMKQDKDYMKFEDLQGLNICVLNFTPAYYFFQAHNRDLIRSRRAFTPPEYQELLDAIPSRNYDCMITDTSFALFLLKNTSEDYKLSDAVLSIDYAVAVRIGDTELLQSLQQALDKLEANGTVAQLQEQWIR